VKWLSSQGPQCSALCEVLRWESTCMVAPGIRGAIVRVSLRNCRFCSIFANFAAIKKLYHKSQCAHHPCTRRHLCAKSDVLTPSQSRDIVWRKSHPIRHPPYFAIREPRCSALRNFILEIASFGYRQSWITSFTDNLYCNRAANLCLQQPQTSIVTTTCSTTPQQIITLRTAASATFCIPLIALILLMLLTQWVTEQRFNVPLDTL